MRRGAVSVPLNGINVGAGPGRGLAGPRAGGSVVLRIAEWARAGGVCCGAGRGARRLWLGTPCGPLPITVRVRLVLSSHVLFWQIR